MARPEDGSATTRRTFLRSLLALAVGGTAGLGAHGYWYARHDLALTATDVPVPGLPVALGGLRVALITDLHRSATVSHAFIRRAVDLAMASAPDLVVLGGDYVTWGDRAFVEPAAEALAGLTAPLGVFAVLGNHDDDRDMPAALARQGVVVLRDARTELTTRGERLDLIGIRFWTRREADIATLLRGAGPAHVLLAHDPRRFEEATALGIPLVLSGHTHGGQVVLPLIGAPAARKFPVLSGLARRGSTTMFVSRGIGTVYVPVRVACPPEVALLTLRPAPAA